MRLPLRRPLHAALLLALAAPAVALAAPRLQGPAPAAEEVRLPAPEELVDDPLQQRLIELGRESDWARRHIEVITGHFPRRLTGCPELELAQGWLLMTFEDMGLAAYREAWGNLEVGFQRGRSSGRVVAPEEQALTFITPAWSPGTEGATRGPALLEPATVEEARERAADLRGAWLLRNPEVSREQRRGLDELYPELGVAGTVQPGLRDGRLRTGGSHRITWEDLPRLVRVTVAHDQYRDLERRLEAGEGLELEFDVQNQFLHGPLTQHNVIAEIEGSEFPDEYVIVQGHMDAWDGAQGACDNGTGMATTLEAARLIQEAGIVPRRTIRFVFYTGEEQGLLGSRGYVERHVDELERVSVVLNHDNGTNHLRGIVATDAMLEDFEAVFEPIGRLDPARPFEVRRVPGLRPGPSDHAPFVEAGVPAFHWDQSEEGYRRLHHTQHDTLAEVDHDDQRHSALVVALAAVRFAELDHLVDRSFLREPDPRRMGVYLGGESGTVVERVSPGGLAAGAGWQAGDRVLAVDGAPVGSRDGLVAAIQGGGPRKVVLLRRGEEEVESVLDWSDDPLEAERRAWRERAAARDGESAGRDG
jgi:carboxypeptidase Q